MTEVFGRTNVPVPRLWFALLSRGTGPDARERLVERALATGAPIGVSSGPSLWGQALGRREATLVACGSWAVSHARDSKQAFDTVTSDLVALLSSIGRDHIDFYFVTVRHALEERQAAGMVEALDAAKDEGLLRFAGLRCDGPGLAGLGLWRLHDAFEAVMAPRNPAVTEPYRTLAPLAHERRVGFVARSPFRWGLGPPAPEVPGLAETAFGWLTAAMMDSPVIVGVGDASEIDTLEAVQCAPVAPTDALARYHDALAGARSL